VTKKLFLVLDQGGQSSRALIIDSQGQVVAQASEPVETRTPQPGWVEQDPEQLVETLSCSAERALAQLSDPQKANIDSAALVTQRSSLVCWHRKTGKAYYPVISWQDRRAAEWLANQDIDNDWLHKRTGLRVSPHYGASKIHWCLDHINAVKTGYDKGNLCVGPLASFLTARLTRERNVYSDPANASRTLLYNLQDNCWDDELLKKFSIPKTILPEIRPTWYDYGTLDLDGMSIPLSLVNGDQSAALFSLGPIKADQAYINVGTGAFISMPVDPAIANPPELLTSIVTQHSGGEIQDRQFVIEGTVNGAGSALSWAQEELGLESYESIDLSGTQKEPFPLFINSIGGLGSPFWAPSHKANFIGSGTEKMKMIAVFESIVFLLAINLQCLQQSGYRPKQLIVSGGLANLDDICQMLADVSMLDVWRPRQVEATARGAVFLLAGKPEEWRADNGEWFRIERSSSVILAKRFCRWRKALVEQLDT